MINVAVHDIDSHYEHAVSEGAAITMPIEDAFYGFRRYEADDLEGHHWHFHESLEAIRERAPRSDGEIGDRQPTGG
jgi:MerR family transcriptional regulator, thiopeptide resistance regulator